MARPREFNTEQVLQAALDAFWRKGYVATSMADLMEATGLQKGSIYKAFGNKHSFFLTALRQYLATGFAAIKSKMELAPDPVSALRAYLEAGVETCKINPKKGCFALNTIAELGPHDETVNNVLDAHFANIRSLVLSFVQKGQEAELIRVDRSADDIAEYIVTVQLGIVSSAKHNIDAQAKMDVVTFALSSLSQ